jgi:hypothetical protein
MLLIGAVWVIYQFVFSKYVEEEASRNIEFLMQQTEKAVKSSLSMIESSVEYFFMDKTLQEWINMDSPSPNDELLGKLNMDEAIQHSLMANSAWENDLMGVAYFYVDQYAFTFYSNGNFPIHDLTQQIKGISAKMQLDSSSELRLFLPKDDTRTFFIGKSYVDEKQKKKNLNLIIAVDEKKLMEEYGVVNQYKGAHAYLVDRKGNIYSSAGDRKIGDRLQKDEKEFFYRRFCRRDESERGDVLCVRKRSLENRAPAIDPDSQGQLCGGNDTDSKAVCIDRMSGACRSDGCWYAGNIQRHSFPDNDRTKIYGNEKWRLYRENAGLSDYGTA